MNAQPIAANPFALMMSPEQVFEALKASQSLAELRARVCRPLDKPLLGRSVANVAEYDAEIDAEDDLDDLELNAGFA